MKTCIILTLAALVGPAFALTDGELTQAYNRIRSDKKNQPRYGQYKHDLILGDLEAFAKTNALSAAQRLTWASKVVQHANTSAAFDATRESAWRELDASTNAVGRIRELSSLFDALIHTYSFEATRGVSLAEKILSENEKEILARLGALRFCRMHQAVASRAIQVQRDREKSCFDRHFAAVKAAAPDEKMSGPAKLAFEKTRRELLVSFMTSLADVDESAARALFERERGELGDAQVDQFYLKLADVAIARKDRAAFDAVQARFAAYPADRRMPFREMIKKLEKFDADTANALLVQELAATKDPAEEFALLAVRQGFNDPPVFNYGFSDPNRYATWRAALLRRLEISDANTNNAACKFFNQASAKAWEVERMIWYDDLPNARKLLDRSLALWPADRKLLTLDAHEKAARGDAAGAVAALRETLALKGTKAAESNDVRRVVAFLEGLGIKGFDAVEPLEGAVRLAALRRASRTLFGFRRYADAQAIYDEIVSNVYRGETRRTLAVSYDPNAPKSADGFVRTKYYDDWASMDTAFRPYGDCYGESAAADEKWHVKGVDLPKADPAYRTGLRVLCDDEAVHLFVRCDYPNVAEVVEGKRKACELEMFLSPGGLDRPYHTIFFTDVPGTEDPHAADWCSPGPHYRRNADAYTKDACLTPEGSVAHVKLPWIAFYDDLPVRGNTWNVGVIRGGAGGMQTNAGVVHELSRGLLLSFDFTPGQLKALKLRVARIAYNRYAKQRNDQGDFILRWNDPLLGDPAFFAAKVTPLLEKLDAAGAELEKADADVDALFDTFVPQWAEMRYVLADLRTRYLRGRLLEE